MKTIKTYIMINPETQYINALYSLYNQRGISVETFYTLARAVLVLLQQSEKQDLLPLIDYTLFCLEKWKNENSNDNTYEMHNQLIELFKFAGIEEDN